MLITILKCEMGKTLKTNFEMRKLLFCSWKGLDIARLDCSNFSQELYLIDLILVSTVILTYLFSDRFTLKNIHFPPESSFSTIG